MTAVTRKVLVVPFDFPSAAIHNFCCAMAVTGPVSYYIVFLLPWITIRGYMLDRNWVTALFVFVVVPLMDLVVPVDSVNPTEEEEQKLAQKFSYRIATFLWVPVNIALIIWGAWTVGNTTFSSWTSLISFVIAIGLNGGLGINCAHELLHKNEGIEKLLAQINLVFVSYGHFYIEHVYGHHKRVATPVDPASAQLGESFYSFWPRTVVGSFVSAWRDESKRLQRGSLPFTSHRVLHYIVESAAICVALCLLFSWKAAPYFVGQSFVAFTLLELVNYIEHYGLSRKEIAPGKYEQVNITHSWNAAHRITNYFLFKLQRHSDHHANSTRRYQVLRSFDESPQLPTGYAGMILLALFPPLFRKLMDSRAIHYMQTKPIELNPASRPK
eukprot:TRINITY_DN2226_c0_g1_i1.p1 TRINITY_DN2226_c0_g1~~TRINITY_DN2226_c0_g1_i1.p1  ORF type:complete len:384 (-),score=67.56 TRINITY_DN2226_c0_g1_i1:784-1935(-)